MNARWIVAALAMAVAAGCTRPRPEKAGPKDVEAGRDAWRNGCATCHVVPDPSLEFDRVWLSMLETTTCITAQGDAPTEEVRRGLTLFLASEPPTPWSGADRPLAGPCGTVAAPFDRGSIVLEPEGATAPGRVRLAWREPGLLRVPAGKYRVWSYEIEERADGRTWVLSCTGSGGPALSVAEGRPSALALATGVFISCKAARTDEGIRVTGGLAGHGGMEASLLDLERQANDRRVPMAFEVLDTEGESLGGGTLAYG